jgi:hypothetical protein
MMRYKKQKSKAVVSQKNERGIKEMPRKTNTLIHTDNNKSERKENQQMLLFYNKPIHRARKYELF